LTDMPPAPRMGRLPIAEWPAADAAAWTLARTPRAGPFSQNPPRSLATYGMYADGYAGYLWHLKSLNQLHPAETPAERVTRERLGSYHERLVRGGLADYTIVARFDGTSPSSPGPAMSRSARCWT